MPVNDYQKFPLSWMPDKSRLTRPQYLSLASLIEEDIANGILLPGAPLPPQRALADYLDLNFTTVTRAYDLCREKNLIYGITGRGTFVTPAPSSTHKDIAELGVVLGFPIVVKPVIEAAHAVIVRDSLTELFSYQARSGLDHHRAAGIQWMARFGSVTDIEHSAVFAGAQNAITVALLSLFHLGDAIAVDSFTYANLIETARLAHLRLVPVSGDHEGMLPDALDLICQKKKIRGIFIMPDCANPTAITMPEARRDAIAAICEKYGLIILEDDASTIVMPKQKTFFSRLPGQTLYISASTRHLAPGLRITFAAFPEKFRQQLTQGLYHTSIKASALDAEIVAQLIMTGNAEKLLHEKHLLALDANQCFEKHFPNAPQLKKNGAFFRTIPLGSAIDGQELEHNLLSHGIRVCHSYRFSVEKNPRNAFLRISLSSMPDLHALDHALCRLKEWLQNRENGNS